MNTNTDAEFFDQELEAGIKEAFNALEPSAEAQQRILQNLLAYEQQVNPQANPHVEQNAAVGAVPEAVAGVVAGAVPDAAVDAAPEATPDATLQAEPPRHLTNEERIARAIEEAKAAVRAQSGLPAQEAGAGAMATGAAQGANVAGADAAAEGASEEEGPVSDAAQIVASAREATPKPKRNIRPWQIAVPVAAVLVLGAVVFAVGPLAGIGPFGGAAASNTTSQAPAEEAALDMAEEAESTQSDASRADTNLESMATSASSAASSEMQDLATAESAIADEDMSSTSSDANAEEASSTDAASEAEVVPDETESISADSQATAESAEESAEASADSGEAEVATETTETDWPKDYPTVVVVIGDEYRLKIDSTTSEAAEKVGSMIADAVAYNEDETASVSCTIYNFTDDDEIYLISYMGEDKYYKAHVVD